MIKEDGTRRCSLSTVAITALPGHRMTVKYNSKSVNLGPLDIDGVTALLSVRLPPTSTSPSQLRHFAIVHIGGDFAFRKTTSDRRLPATRIEVVASNVSVSLSLGSVFTARLRKSGQPGAGDQGRRQQGVAGEPGLGDHHGADFATGRPIA